MKQLTKSMNKRKIIVYYSLALIFVIVGLYLKDTKWYIIAVVFLGLAMFRKHWLHKKLEK